MSNTNIQSPAVATKYASLFSCSNLIPFTPPADERKRGCCKFVPTTGVAMGLGVCLYSRHQDSATILLTAVIVTLWFLVGGARGSS
jgi:hypothetical protein